MIAQLDEIQWGKLVAEAWMNPQFNADLKRDPSAAVRQFAAQHFGVELDGEIGAFELPELPPGMAGEQLSSASVQVQACVTGSASSGGDVRGCLTGCASSGGEVRGCLTGCASSGGDANN